LEEGPFALIDDDSLLTGATVAVLPTGFLCRQQCAALVGQLRERYGARAVTAHYLRRETDARGRVTVKAYPKATPTADRRPTR